MCISKCCYKSALPDCARKILESCHIKCEKLLPKVPKVVKKMPKIQKFATWASKVAPARYLKFMIFSLMFHQKNGKRILINRLQMYGRVFTKLLLTNNIETKLIMAICPMAFVGRNFCNVKFCWNTKTCTSIYCCRNWILYLYHILFVSIWWVRRFVSVWQVLCFGHASN